MKSAWETPNNLGERGDKEEFCLSVPCWNISCMWGGKKEIRMKNINQWLLHIHVSCYQSSVNFQNKHVSSLTQVRLLSGYVCQKALLSSQKRWIKSAHNVRSTFLFTAVLFLPRSERTGKVVFVAAVAIVWIISKLHSTRYTVDLQKITSTWFPLLLY